MTVVQSLDLRLGIYHTQVFASRLRTACAILRPSTKTSIRIRLPRSLAAKDADDYSPFALSGRPPTAGVP
jgi:hypothetical protein